MALPRDPQARPSARARDGDPSVGPDIAESHVAFVWRSLRRLGVPDHSLDDATQEVFVAAMRNRVSFEGRSSFKTWLYGISVNVALRVFSTARRHRSEPLSDTLADNSEPCQEQLLDRREAVRTLYSLLEALTEERRVVFVMAELEQMTAPEIAEVIAAPLGTVYSRLRAARSDFDSALKRHRARERSGSTDYLPRINVIIVGEELGI